jgi:hypothetical protein
VDGGGEARGRGGEGGRERETPAPTWIYRRARGAVRATGGAGFFALGLGGSTGAEAGPRGFRGADVPRRGSARRTSICICAAARCASAFCAACAPASTARYCSTVAMARARRGLPREAATRPRVRGRSALRGRAADPREARERSRSRGRPGATPTRRRRPNRARWSAGRAARRRDRLGCSRAGEITCRAARRRPHSK